MLINELVFQYKRVRIGGKCLCYGKIYIYGDKNKITIGNNCIFRSGLKTNPLGGAQK